MALRTGDMNRRLTLQQVQRLPAEAGFQSGQWFDLNKIWAKVTPITGTRLDYFGQTIDNKPYEISTKWSQDFQRIEDSNSELNKDYRLVEYDTNGTVLRQFTIASVINVDDEKREFHIIAHRKE